MRLFILALLFPIFAFCAKEEEKYLYVLHSQSGEIHVDGESSRGSLIMDQADESVAFFSYRQNVNARLIPITDFINFWKSGQSFFKTPPVALVVAYTPEGEFFSEVSARLSHPRYNILEKRLTFDATWFEALKEKQELKEVSLLIESKVLLDETP